MKERGKKSFLIFFVLGFSSKLMANPIVIIPEEKVDFQWQAGFVFFVFVFFVFSLGLIIEYLIAVYFLQKKIYFNPKIFWLVIFFNIITYPVTLYLIFCLHTYARTNVLFAEIYPFVAETFLWYGGLLWLREKIPNIPKGKVFCPTVLAFLANIGSFSLTFLYL